MGNITRGFQSNNNQGPTAPGIINRGFEYSGPNSGIPMNTGPGVPWNRGPWAPGSGMSPPFPAQQPDPSFVDPSSPWYRRLHYQDFGPGPYWWGGAVNNQYTFNEFPPVGFPMYPSWQDGTASQPAASDYEADARLEREAKRAQERAAAWNDQRPMLMAKGTGLFRKGQYLQAGTVFSNVLSHDPQDTEARLNYAVARFAIGKYEAAAGAICQAMTRMPSLVDQGFDVPGRYGSPSQFSDQLAKLDGYLKERPNDVNALIVLGFVQHFSNQRKLAAETFQRIQSSSRRDAILVANIFLRTQVGPTGTGAIVNRSTIETR